MFEKGGAARRTGSYIIDVVSAASHALERDVAKPTGRTVGMNIEDERTAIYIAVATCHGEGAGRIEIDVVDELAVQVAARHEG